MLWIALFALAIIGLQMGIRWVAASIDATKYARKEQDYLQRLVRDEVRLKQAVKQEEELSRRPLTEASRDTRSKLLRQMKESSRKRVLASREAAAYFARRKREYLDAWLAPWKSGPTPIPEWQEPWWQFNRSRK